MNEHGRFRRNNLIVLGNSYHYDIGCTCNLTEYQYALKPDFSRGQNDLDMDVFNYVGVFRL